MTIRSLILFLLLLAVNPFTEASVWAASVLKAINRSDESTYWQLYLHFDQLPGFQLSTNGRRVDVELLDTTPDPFLPSLAVDDKMIKATSNTLKTKTILSLYFRYPPQKVTAESNKETAMLLLDVLLGNQLSASYPELSTKLQGVSVVKRAGGDALNPVNISPYANNWPSFFTDYEAPLSIKPPPAFHLPPFPLASALAPDGPLTAWLPEEIQTLASNGKWNQVSQLLREQVALHPDERLKERLVLTYAEALVRAEVYREPYFLLQRIMIQYPDSLLADLAHVLLIYQQATRGDQINAYYELDGLLKKMGQKAPFTDSLPLLLAELALVAGRTVDAEKQLAGMHPAQDTPLWFLRLMRQADLLYVTNEKVKALTAYLNLAARTPMLAADPMSLAFFSDCLYAAKRFPEAAKRYMLLADLLNNRPDQDMALFRAAMAHLRTPATEKKARIDFQQIQDAFGQSEGGVRALIKQTDLDFAAKRIPPQEALSVYGKYAAAGDAIALREEALFKQALVNALSEEHAPSVSQCMELLRGFQSGNLRTEATALLIQQLPSVIQQLVKEGEYIKALVLAKQNKKIFARGWLDPNLLFDLARAYEHLDMADQAAQTYQYLFEVTDEGHKEKIYLPLLQSLFAAGGYLQIQEYADRYHLRYPNGPNRAPVLLIKARALYASGQADKAIKVMTAANSPRLPELELLKGRIFFESGQWRKAIETLEQPDVRRMLAQHSMLLALAEAYFQDGKDEQAAPLFQQLASGENGGEQARYRLAQIEAKKENKQQALNLFKELAEKGKDPLWTKLAREAAAILDMQQR